MNGVNGLRAWFATHQRQALIGGGVLVGGYALYRVHANGGFGASNGSASVNPNVAGLTAPPPDSTTGAITSGGSSQLSAIEQLLNSRLPAPGPTKPKTPKPPPALPKPGHGRYVIRGGDTLARISQLVYGKVTGGTLARLRNANPTLASFGRNDKLSHYAGDQIHLPKLAHPAPAPVKHTNPPKKH